MKMTSPIAKLFGKSPFGPIQEHMRVVERCAAELPPLLAALTNDDLDTVRGHRDAISALEHEADEMKNGIRSGLPATLLLPVARRDLLALLATQDAIADAAQDAAGLLALGRLRVTPAIASPIDELCRSVVEVVSQARGLVDQLDELLELGFRGREADRLLERIGEVSAQESRTDQLGSDLVRLLFDHEDEMGPLSVVFWYEIVRTLGRVADEAENVGDRLRLLIAR
jgi:predicted phosphate transport protein (TIGR00153 family)